LDLDAIEPDYALDPSSPGDEIVSHVRWTNDRAEVCLCFGPTSGKVVMKMYDALRPAKPTLAELLELAEEKWQEWQDWFLDE
jgi:hypothetical protein